MVGGINKMLAEEFVTVRIGSDWFVLDSVELLDGEMPIIVSDDKGEEYEFDMADVEEFESESEGVEALVMMGNCSIVGIT